MNLKQNFLKVSSAVVIAAALVLALTSLFTAGVTPVTAGGEAQLRVAHLAPFATDPGTAVTITLDGTPVLTNFEFAESTTYLTVASGEHLVEVWAGGAVAVSATVDLADGLYYSAIAVGGANGHPLQLLPVLNDSVASGNAKVRFGHFAPFAAVISETLADIRNDSGTVVVNDVTFGALADYIQLPAGEYDLQVTSADGGEVYIDLEPFTLAEGDIVYALAVGDGSNQPLDVFAWFTDLEGVLLPKEMAHLRVAHLAPFAINPGTAVTVTLDGTPILTNFEFIDSTDYLPVPGGQHLVEVWAGGAVAISGTVDLTVGTDYTAIAVGGANGHPLSLWVAEDDNSAPTAGNFKIRFGHLAPFAAVLTDTLADIRTDAGMVVVDDVPYGTVAGYMELPVGEYDLRVTSADGATVYIDLAPAGFVEGDILYAVAIGDGANQDLDVFAWFTGQEGRPLVKEEAYLRVAHLAPFATDPGTAVTVTLDSTPVLTNFEFGDSTAYLTVPSGEHLVEVWAGGAVAISATVNFVYEGFYSAIATGGANGYPLNLWLGTDNNEAPAAGQAKVRFGHLAPFTAVLTDTVADIRTDDGTVVVNDVLFGQVASMYMELPAGVYNLQVTSADGSAVYFDIAPFVLAEGDIAYAVAAGDGTNQEIGVFAWFTNQVGGFLAAERNSFLPIINR